MSSQFSILTRGTRARRQGSGAPLPGRFPTKVIRSQGQNQMVGLRVPDSDIEKSLYWQPPNFRIHYLKGMHQYGHQKMYGWDDSAGGGAFEQQRPAPRWLPPSMVVI